MPPKARGKLPPRVPNPRRMGPRGERAQPSRGWLLPHAAHVAPREGWPLPVDPRNPSGGPGTIPITPETFPVAET